MDPLPGGEAIEAFQCFGAGCAVLVTGPGPAGTPGQAARRAKRRLLDWHAQFSRFESGSELSRLNGDPHETVPVSSLMARFVDAALSAAGVEHEVVTLADAPHSFFDRHFEDFQRQSDEAWTRTLAFIDAHSRA